jgi:hypothetical protein
VGSTHSFSHHGHRVTDIRYHDKRHTMTATIECDLLLYRDWPERCVYANDISAPALVLETKSVTDGPGELWQLLNEMTGELREQFRFFRGLREQSEAQVEDDEAAGKLARADAKAATDAISLIVRTLEKIDGLQRQLARDRDMAQQSEAESQDYEAAVEFFMQQIDSLADQKFKDRCKAAGLPPQQIPTAETGE